MHVSIYTSFSLLNNALLSCNVDASNNTIPIQSIKQKRSQCNLIFILIILFFVKK